MKSVMNYIGLLSLTLQTFGLMMLTMICACSHTLGKPEWAFEKAALSVRLIADNNLNLYRNKAHTLYVCIYQLESLNSFDQLSGDPEGIRRLLDCRLYDDTVAAADNKVIHAGEDIVLTLDRAERAQHMALVAGYSSMLSNDRAVRRLKFRVYKTSNGLFKKADQCRPCRMKAEIALGPNQIEYGKIIPNEEVMCNDICE